MKYWLLFSLRFPKFTWQHASSIHGFFIESDITNASSKPAPSTQPFPQETKQHVSHDRDYPTSHLHQGTKKVKLMLIFNIIMLYFLNFLLKWFDGCRKIHTCDWLDNWTQIKKFFWNLPWALDLRLWAGVCIRKSDWIHWHLSSSLKKKKRKSMQ